MIKKNFINKQTSYLRKLACLLLFFLISCQQDQVCIDSDDFGEYETRTFTVESSLIDKYCTYNDKLERNSPLQPCGIRLCLNYQNSQNSQNDPYECEQACKVSNNLSNLCGVSFKSVEPLWVSVGKPLDKILIDPNSKILITAQGNVFFGGVSDKPSLRIFPGNNGKEKITPTDVDVIKVGNENLNLFFYNNFTEGTKTYFKDTNNLSSILSSSSPDNQLNLDADIANGARKVFAYFTPYPDGMNSEYKKVNVPNFPDPDAWKICNQDGSKLDCWGASNPCTAGTESSCGNYSSLLGTQSSQIVDTSKYNAHLTNLFKISNEEKANSRFEGTGFIKSKAEAYISGTDEDPNSVDDIKDNFLLSTGGNNNPISFFPLNAPLDKDYVIRFDQSSDANNRCSASDIKLYITPSSGSPSYEETFDYSRDYNLKKGYVYSLKNSGSECEVKIKRYHYHEIDFEKSGYVSFGIPKSFFDGVSENANANRRNCRLRFQIINADGTEDFKNFGDYFGFINNGVLTSALISPPNTLPDQFYVKSLSASSHSSITYSPNQFTTITASFALFTFTANTFYAFKKNGSNYIISPLSEDGLQLVEAGAGKGASDLNIDQQFFVRKNQKIRFHPSSWNGTWTAKVNNGLGGTTNISVKCGDGFYVKQIHRPAVFCTNIDVEEYRNVNEDLNLSNDCKDGFAQDANGKNVGCDLGGHICNNYVDIATSGSTSTYNNKYCPQECIDKDYTNCRANFDYADSTAEVLNAKSSCTPSGREKGCYEYSIPSNCPFSSCVLFSTIASQEPYKSEIATIRSPAPTGNAGLNQTKCTNCQDELKIQALKVALSKTTSLLKQCYDIEDYEGSLENLHEKLNALNSYANSTPSKAKLAYRIINDHDSPASSSSNYDYSSLKGVKQLKTFDGTYGNLYPFKYSKENISSYPILQLKNYVSAIKDGYLKFIILPNVDTAIVSTNINDFPEKYFLWTPKNSNLPTSSITSNLIIKLKSLSDFSNGQQLAVNVCKESVIDGNDCVGTYQGVAPYTVTEASANGSRVNHFISSSPPYKIIQYSEANTPKFSADSENKYGFNNIGQLTRISASNTASIDCDNPLDPYVGANFLCFNQAVDEGKYRLNFKIIDNEVPSCTGNGNGASDCTSGLGSTCNNYKITNYSYNPSSSANVQYGTQASINATTGQIIPASNSRFFCVDNKYLNNSGHYDVTVKIKRDAKVQVSNFIDSLISPIMKEIDGDDQASKMLSGFTSFSAVETTIMADKFYNDIDDPSASSPYHDYAYDANNVLYPYFSASLSKTDPADPNNNLLLPDINLNNFKAQDPSIIGVKTKIMKVDGNATVSLVLDPKQDDATNCNSSCYVKYISGAVVASIKKNASNEFSNFEKKCFLRSNRSSTLAQVKSVCKNTVNCIINFNQNTFPLTVFAINETDNTQKYKSPDSLITAQPYSSSPSLKFKTSTDPSVSATNITISQASPKTLKDLEVQIPDCNEKYLVVQYIYAKTENPLFKENQVKRLYKLILVNPVYKSFLTLSVVLMFSFYGLGFLMGVSELKQSEIIDRLVKVGIIYLFTNPSIGWVWFEKFFVTFFKNGTEFLTFLMASIFDESGKIDTMLMRNDYSDKTAIFESVDKVVDMFLVNDVVHKKISALLFYKFFGIIYMMIIYYSAIAYVYGISNAVLLYLTSQFFTSVLLMVGPFFFVFILFKQTKTFFDNWINSLIGFSLQQIFLVFTLTLFNTFLYLIIKLNLGYSVCWDDVWKVTIGNQRITLFSFWTPQDSPSIINSSVEINIIGSSMPSLPKVLSLWTVCVLMKTFISQITDLAATLSGGMTATELGSNLSRGITKMIESKKEALGSLYKKTGLDLVARADQKLFDSGQLAKAQRKQALAKDKEEQRIKEKMLKEGNKAVSNYKVENAEKFSKMSEEEKVKELIKVKQNGMRQAAIDMGKTSGQVDKLMNSKGGVKYQGDNVFGLIKSVATNQAKDSNSSLNEKSLKVDTGMSKNEMQKALKNIEDPEKRKELINNIKDGKINKSEKGVLPESVNKFIPDRSNISLSERSNAIKELEKSGQISKQNNMFEHNTIAGKLNQATGAGMTNRTSKEEEKIIAKIQENRLAQTFDKGSNVSSKDINKLEAFEKRLEQKEAKLNPEERLDQKKETLKERSADEKTEDKKNNLARLQGNIDKLNDEKEKNKDPMKEAKENANKSQEKLNKFDKDMTDDHKQMKSLESKIKSGSATNTDVKKFAQLRESDKANKGTGKDFDSVMKERSNLDKDNTIKQNAYKNLQEKDKNIEKEINKNQAQRDKIQSKIPANNDDGQAGGATPASDGSAGGGTPAIVGADPVAGAGGAVGDPAGGAVGGAGVSLVTPIPADPAGSPPTVAPPPVPVVPGSPPPPAPPAPAP